MKLRACRFPTDDTWLQSRSALSWEQWPRPEVRGCQGPGRGWRTDIREAYEEHTGLGYAAEALLLAGNYDAAHAELQEALRVGEELGERVYLPQLLMLEAAIARAQGRSDASNAALRRAIEEARAQEASWLELLARRDAAIRAHL